MNLLRLPKVLLMTGLSRHTIRRLEKKGEFPKRVQISENAVGWHLDQIEAWVAARPDALNLWPARSVKIDSGDKMGGTNE